MMNDLPDLGKTQNKVVEILQNNKLVVFSIAGGNYDAKHRR